MHDSLLNRFRGALVGAWLGESIAKTASPRAPDAKPEAPILDNAITPLLLQGLFTQPPIWEQSETGVGQDQAREELDFAEKVVLSLPIALFYHDQPQMLRSALQQFFSVTQTREAAWAIVLGELLSLILRERLQPDDWMHPVLHSLDAVGDRSLVAQLQQVQFWLERPTNLVAIAQGSAQSEQFLENGALPIQLALYGFFSTPDSVSLTLRRLQQLPTFTPICGLIAGALTGAYNGVAGIPRMWRQQGASSGTSIRDELALLENGLTEADLFQAADRLLAIWSGADYFADWQQKLSYTHIITAPRVIRFR